MSDDKTTEIITSSIVKQMSNKMFEHYNIDKCSKEELKNIVEILFLIKDLGTPDYKEANIKVRKYIKKHYL